MTLEVYTDLGVSRQNGFVMFDVPALTRETLRMSEELGFNFGFKQCKRIVLKAIRRIEIEETRLFGLTFETSDDYRTTSYSDPTGEQAVRNVIRSLLANT